jgi:clan AA aspartic protease
MERLDMGHVFAEVTLKNVYDMGYARNGDIKEEEVRSLTVQAVVDTGATRLCISEEMRQKLGLRIVGSTPIHIANGNCVACQVTEPVEIICKNRSSTFNAIIIPGSVVALLGVIPLEDLDLMVNPVTQELVGVHGDEPHFLALSSLEDHCAR